MLINLRQCLLLLSVNDFCSHIIICMRLSTQTAKFMEPTWGPSGSCRPQMGSMLASWTLLSGQCFHQWPVPLHSVVPQLYIPIPAQTIQYSIAYSPCLRLQPALLIEADIFILDSGYMYISGEIYHYYSWMPFATMLLVWDWPVPPAVISATTVQP